MVFRPFLLHYSVQLSSVCRAFREEACRILAHSSSVCRRRGKIWPPQEGISEANFPPSVCMHVLYVVQRLSCCIDWTPVNGFLAAIPRNQHHNSEVCFFLCSFFSSSDRIQPCFTSPVREFIMLRQKFTIPWSGDIPYYRAQWRYFSLWPALPAWNKSSCRIQRQNPFMV